MQTFNVSVRGMLMKSEFVSKLAMKNKTPNCPSSAKKESFAT